MEKVHHREQNHLQEYQTLGNILNEKEIYQNATSNILNSVSIISYKPIITPQDIDNGYVMRYFVRPTAQKAGEITEINLNTYQTVYNNVLYTAISIPWQIKGNVADVFQTLSDGTIIKTTTGIVSVNRQLLQNADLTIPGMIFQITNYLQFYQGS